MLNQNNKGIQLSEKMEYFMLEGTFYSVQRLNGVVHYYVIKESQIVYTSHESQRLLDFINDLVEKRGCYPLIQKFVTERNNAQKNEKELQRSNTVS